MTDALKAKVVNLEDLNAHSKVLFNKGVGNRGTCTTAAATAAKAVTFGTTFSLVDGATALVRFTYGISVGGATLAVTYTNASGSSATTDAKPIYYCGASLPAGLVKAKDLLLLKYNGSQWDVVGHLDTGTTLIPVDVNSLTTSSTFVKDNIVAVNGIIYHAKQDTSNFPVKLIVDANGKFCIDQINGVTYFAVANDTVNSDWEVWMDIRDRYYTELVRKDCKKYTDQLRADINAGYGLVYVTCTTAGGTAAKTVALSGFTLIKNRPVSILFTNGFTTTSPTLNINGTGAKPIKYFGEDVAPVFIGDNTIATMVYDGTNWNIISLRTYTGQQKGFVDLGLPSGLLWADKNIGANSITDFGLYFQWGGTTGYTIEQASQVTTENYNASSAHSISADLALSEDAARVNMGSPWRMPTKAEAQELIAYCSFETATINGVSGIMATGPNGNSIFFPEAGMINASGNYVDGGWIMLTSSLSSFEPSLNAAAFANSAGATWGAKFSISDSDRARGVVIRPVM